MTSPGMRTDRSDLRLWAGVLVAPAAWGLSLLVSYAVVAERCTPALTLTLTIVTALAAAGGTALAVRELRRLGAAHEDTDRSSAGSAPARHQPGTRDRQLLMGKVGTVLGILMVVAIVAHGISLFIIGCL